MSTAFDRIHRPLADLSPDERQRLEAAHAHLRAAVEVYEQFVSGELDPSQPVPTHDLRLFAEAQADVEVAEADLWSAREELLGWVCPGWAPSAIHVADWFSDEDRIYDGVADTTRA